MTQIRLSGRFRQTATRVRRDPSSGYVNGRYVQGGSTTNTVFNCNIQPLNSNKGYDIVKDLPEGQRKSSMIVIYCPLGTLQVANEGDNTQSDRVLTDEGETFEIKKINSWRGRILNHDQAYGVRVEND